MLIIIFVKTLILFIENLLINISYPFVLYALNDELNGLSFGTNLIINNIYGNDNLGQRNIACDRLYDKLTKNIRNTGDDECMASSNENEFSPGQI